MLSKHRENVRRNFHLASAQSGKDSLLTLRLNLNNDLARMKHSILTTSTLCSPIVRSVLMTGVALGLAAASALATDRRFTYTYEPETLPAGAKEFEQWVTLGIGRTKNVGQENFNRWDFREEFEYGVTDNYQIALYLNGRNTSYRDGAGNDISDFSFEGVSLENKYNLLNPATKPVGVSLYLEGTYSGTEAEIEQKIIFGQRHGDWKWALNLTHATEWEDNLHEVEGELEGTIGIARDLGKRWTLGLELRSITKIPNYEEFETTALYLGPTVSYRQDNWWAALSVMPQVWGRDWDHSGDGHDNLDLAHNERVQIRLLFGIDF